MKTKLTRSNIAAFKTDQDEAVLWDTVVPTFGVRARNTGSKTYLIQGRSKEGKQYRKSLGDVGKMDVNAAREVAKTLFAQIQLGHDPAADRLAAKTAKAELTFAELADRYLADRKPVVAAGSYRDMSRFFAVGWAPLRRRPADAIARSEIAKCLQDMTQKSGPVAAARARSYGSAAYSWG